MHHKRTRICEREAGSGDITAVSLSQYNGKAIKSSGREVYYVQNGTLHLIPDLPTFFSLNLELEKVIQLADNDMRRLPLGPSVPKKEE
jgi:hypothetical protein